MEKTSMSSAMAYSPVAVHPYQFGLLAGGELGLFALEPAAGEGDGHALAGAHFQQVGFETRRTRPTC
jgi:hypothetical protein